ncbi:MAG: hypothetical protein JW939_08870 [Candidatus Thermoplasmatota archaeon]|nr:hypothetical protein [Candidatus Thermoplasmatota archaeon]
MSPGVVETGGGLWIRRKVFHMAVGLTFLLSIISFDRTRWFFLAVLGLGLVLTFLMEKRPIRVLNWFLSRYDKTTDVIPGQGPITFFTGVLLAWFVFGGDAAALGVAALMFGDPMAYVMGKSIGGPSLPWNGRKTVSGSLSFAVVTTVVVSVVWGPITGIVTGIAGALAESLPLPNRVLTDDNVIIPVMVAAVVFVTSLFYPPIL